MKPRYEIEDRHPSKKTSPWRDKEQEFLEKHGIFVGICIVIFLVLVDWFFRTYSLI